MNGEAKMILVVEDEPLIRMDIVETLEDAGYIVLEAGDASEALDVLAAHPAVAGVFTDIDMPGDLNGLDLATMIRTRDASIAIVIASGRRNLAPRDLPDNGRFFAKPYRPVEVVQSLNAMLAIATG